MHIHQLSPTELVLSDQHRADLNVTQESSAITFNALNMFVASLGRCTFAVLRHYGMRLDVPVKNITTHMVWTQEGSKPARIATINLHIHWPELPEKRLASVERATKMCTIHNTIHECVAITTRVTIGEAEA